MSLVGWRLLYWRMLIKENYSSMCGLLILLWWIESRLRRCKLIWIDGVGFLECFKGVVVVVV